MKRNKLEDRLIRILPVTFTIPAGRLPNSADEILPALLNRIGDLIQHLAYPVALIGLVYTAYILITSIGNPEAITKAKKNITYIATGILIIYFSQYIIMIVKDVLLR